MGACVARESKKFNSKHKVNMRKDEFSNYYSEESLSSLEVVLGKARLGKYLVTLKEIINLKEKMIDLE